MSHQGFNLLCFDEARQVFLAAMHEMLADPAIDRGTKSAEAWATISAVSGVVLWSEVGCG